MRSKKNNNNNNNNEAVRSKYDSKLIFASLVGQFDCTPRSTGKFSELLVVVYTNCCTVDAVEANKSMPNLHAHLLVAAPPGPALPPPLGTHATDTLHSKQNDTSKQKAADESLAPGNSTAAPQTPVFYCRRTPTPPPRPPPTGFHQKKDWHHQLRPPPPPLPHSLQLRWPAPYWPYLSPPSPSSPSRPCAEHCGPPDPPWFFCGEEAFVFVPGRQYIN